jgi:hypothetical protein
VGILVNCAKNQNKIEPVYCWWVESGKSADYPTSDWQGNPSTEPKMPRQNMPPSQNGFGDKTDSERTNQDSCISPPPGRLVQLA